MAELIAHQGVDCCLMHMLGEPRTMQQNPRYDEVVSDVKAFLEERMRFAVAHGIAEERILLDPGIGFGKTIEHNLELLRRLDELAALGRPIVIGTSRKSFLAEPSIPPRQRVAQSVAAAFAAVARGASLLRVHDVAETVQAVRGPAAVRNEAP